MHGPGVDISRHLAQTYLHIALCGEKTILIELLVNGIACFSLLQIAKVTIQKERQPQNNWAKQPEHQLLATSNPI